MGARGATRQGDIHRFPDVMVDWANEHARLVVEQKTALDKRHAEHLFFALQLRASAICARVFESVDNLIDVIVGLIFEDATVVSIDTDVAAACHAICVDELHDVPTHDAWLGAACALEAHELILRFLVREEACERSSN